jgi:hypothetical protein
VDVAAIVADLLRQYSREPGAKPDVDSWITRDPRQANRLRLVALACWLFHDPGLQGKVDSPVQIATFLKNGLDPLAEVMDAAKFVADEERREELVRLCLHHIGMKPEGESDQQAEDRLATLDSMEQRRILRDTAQAQRRAEEVREALRRKAAQEAAAKVSRE